MGDQTEQFVPGGVSVGFVDLFEAVQVEQRDGQWPAGVPLGVRRQPDSVRQTGRSSRPLPV